MIRTEILIRAGRQHLSRSILARAVARVLDDSTTFSITLDGSSAIQPRDPSHRRFPLASVAATKRRRCHSRTRSHAPGWLFRLRRAALIRATLFFYSQAPNHAERRRRTVAEHPATTSVSCGTRENKKRKKTTRVAQCNVAPCDVSRHVDAVRLDSRLNRSERSTWSGAVALLVARPSPLRLRSADFPYSYTADSCSPGEHLPFFATPRDNIVVGWPPLSSPSGRCIARLRLRRAERHETPRAAATNQCGRNRRTQR